MNGLFSENHIVILLKNMYFVCGDDQYFQLGEKHNYENSDGINVISPLKNVPLFTSGLKSYSIYGAFSIVVTDKNKLYGIGYNTYCQISGSLPHEVINHYEPFEIKDDQDRTLVPKSAVCGQSYSLYLLEKPEDSTKSLLAYSYSHTTSNYPEILNTGNLNPIALYGGCENAAAIDDQGHIIYIYT